MRPVLLFSLLLALTASGAKPKAPAKGPAHRLAPWNTSHVEVQQLTGDPERGKRAWSICAGCHGAEGFGRSDGVVPSMAGQWAQVTVKQLVDIRTGRRDSVFMYRFAVTLTDPQELADLAAYLATLEPSKENGKGSGLMLERGRDLYEQACLVCHGRNGEGEARLFFPRLTGQHAKYVRRMLVEIKEGTRRNANPTMQKAMEGWSDKDLEAVADYVSQLRVVTPSPR